MRILRILFSLITIHCLLLLVSCSLDYGNQESEKGLPDIVMESVDYVRVRGADSQARLQAERVERYEERRLMTLLNFSFEQFGNRGADVNAFGRAGSGSFEIDSGDIHMDDTVRIEIESEDIIIETEWLKWSDKEKVLLGGDEEEVVIQQQNGTTFTGMGFRADSRRRTWEFSGIVAGTFIQDDDEEEEEEASGESPENETEAEISGDESQAEVTV